MKRFLMIVFGAFLMVAPGYQGYKAFAEETDDVFIDEGGGIGDAPSDSIADVPPDEEPADAAPAPAAAPVAADEFVDESAPAPDTTAAADEPAPAKASKAKKAKKETKKEAKVAKVSKKAKAGKSRKVASKEGFRMLKEDCPMYSDASADSQVLITVKGSRKLWVEEHDSGWIKGFRKNGHGFMKADCFE